MKHLYNSSTVLQTESTVFLEANYNRVIHNMTKTGDVIYYQAPEDPSSHPMYVDAGGRNVPVDPETLQPMTNAAGNLVDKNGVLLPRDEITNVLPHKDDVRIAVTSAEFEVKDEDGNDILISPDGDIIPTDDNGVPATTLVNGEVWVVDEDGNPVAPLDRIYPLHTYVRPVRAENVPITPEGELAPVVEDQYLEYFDISHIVKAERPSKRGVLVAWASTSEDDSPVMAGTYGYKGARHYTASKEFPYKYWTSPTTADPVGVPSGDNITTFDSTWTVAGGTGVVRGTNLISADFVYTRFTSNSEYFQKVLNLDSSVGYEASFTVMAQNQAQIVVELHEWSDTQADPHNDKSGSYLRRTVLQSKTAPQGTPVNINVGITPSAESVTQVLRILVKRTGVVTKPKVTLTGLSFKAINFPIASVGPRAVYDRPIDVNKIVIGIDYSLDEMASRESHTNKPGDYAVRIYKERGDGLFTWETVSETPYINDNGHIVLNYDGSGWGAGAAGEDTVTIMGVQLVVFGMKRRGARVNVMEISARRRYDVSDLLISYEYNSNVSDDSFVLPFGTVNSNNGSVSLSNHDGWFNPGNEYLLNRAATAADGSDTFTDVPNPFYRILNGAVDIEIETATFEPGSTERDFVRVVTARTTDRIDAGSSMTANIDFIDDSEILQRTDAPKIFYTSQTMSTIQVLYMLLDSIGFTSVKFADEDEHFATHLKYFWTKKDADNVWSVIEEVCRATQTVAFFDEYNILNFKSLKGMYEDALAKEPAQILTTEDLPGVKSNIIEMELDEKVSANKVTVNYRETSEPEKTPSGATPMTVVWEPDGTQVIRANYLKSDLNAIHIGKSGASEFLNIPGEAAKTWPFEGMVNCEGEYIRYNGKEYLWHTADGSKRWSIVMNEDERKALDKHNEFMVHKNTWTGKMKIKERGAEGTSIKAHTRGVLTDFTRRFRQGSTILNNYNKGLSIKNSRLFVVGQTGTKANGLTSITHGSTSDAPPTHLGARFRVNTGPHAGVCFGMGANDDGVFVEVTTTESNEVLGRPRGELHVFVRKNGVDKFYGFGVDVPVSRYKDYDIDVSVKDGVRKTSSVDYSRFYAISLRAGDRGDNVRYLQTALNEHQERLVVDGIFGTLTRGAVLRLQSRKGLTRDGIVNEEEWKAMEVGAYDGDFLSVHATIDGNYSLTTTINKSELPINWNGGRFGVFTRGRTTGSFEYLYAMRGFEDIEFDDSMFFDYVQGGYVSDQLDAGWIYNTKKRWLTHGGQRYQRWVVSDQLFMHDFGPYIHEMREYDVEFKDDEPALSSYVYLSNTNQVHLTDYLHRPFSARINLVNKSREDAVINGEDTVTYGSENSIQQKFMIYGTTLKIDDERSVTVSDKSSVDSRGVDELTIDVDWIQSEESANKLGSHIIEAMSNSVSTYSVDIFGNAALRVGQIVSIYNPQQGIGDPDHIDSMNRFFVYGVSQGNSGAQSTTVQVREVIGGSGLRNIRLRDVLAKNNNAMNMNPEIEESRYDIDRKWIPSGYDFRGGVTARYVSASLSGGGGAARLTGTSGTPYQTSMLLNPYPDGVGRFAHSYGDHYLFTVNVTANTRVSTGIVIEGWPTTGSMKKALASKVVRLEKGQNRDITMVGQFLTDPDIPELELSVRVLNPDNHGQGASAEQSVTVNSAYFRSSQNQDDIYPLHGGEKFRKS